MNPLDSHFRRNRFSGCTARSARRSMFRAAKPKNKQATPLRKLGLVWKVVTDGLPLIEHMLNERSFTEFDAYDEFIGRLGNMPPEASRLADFYATVINDGYETWAAQCGGEDQAQQQIAEFVRFLRPAAGARPLIAWLQTLDAQSGDGASEWLIGHGGKAFELAVGGILRTYEPAATP